MNCETCKTRECEYAELEKFFSIFQKLTERILKYVNVRIRTMPIIHAIWW